MELFQSWADTVLMIILFIAYIVTFFVQRTTITKLKEQIDVIEKAINAGKTLTDMQAGHIDTYKKIVDIKDIDQYAQIKATNIFAEMLSNRDDLIDELKSHADVIINKNLLDTSVELMMFLKSILIQLKFDKEQEVNFIKKTFKNGHSDILAVFEKLADKSDTQKNQNL